MQVIVTGPVTATIDKVDGKQTVGAFADQLANEHGVAGDEFSLKVNGDLLARTAPVGGVPPVAIVELVEVTDEAPAQAAAPAPAIDAEPADGE